MTKESLQGGAGVPNDLRPARAIRRALATSGLKARDVDFVAVHASGPHAREQAEQAVTRGLGRFAAGVTVVLNDPDPFGRCAAMIDRGEAQVAVALVIDPAGDDRALAYSRSR